MTPQRTTHKGAPASAARRSRKTVGKGSSCGLLSIDKAARGYDGFAKPPRRVTLTHTRGTCRKCVFRHGAGVHYGLQALPVDDRRSGR
jgi:hypothetical protein